MKNKYLGPLMIITATLFSLVAIFPITAHAETKTGWVQEASEGAPVHYYTFDDSHTEENIQDYAQFLRESGWPEAKVQNYIAKQRAEWGLTSSASSTQTSTSTKAEETRKSEPAYTQEQIDAAWEEISKTDATCTDGAKTEYKNSITGKTKTEVTSDPNGHSYKEEVTVEATCVNEGTMTYTCSVCGDSYEDVIPVADVHTYKTVTTEATCIADGHITHTCTACSDTYEEPLPAFGHKAGEVVVTKEPGLFTEGTSIVSCDTCGEVLKEDTLSQTFPLTLKNTLIISIFVAIAGILSATIMIKMKPSAHSSKALVR